MGEEVDHAWAHRGGCSKRAKEGWWQAEGERAICWTQHAIAIQNSAAHLDCFVADPRSLHITRRLQQRWQSGTHGDHSACYSDIGPISLGEKPQAGVPWQLSSLAAAREARLATTLHATVMQDPDDCTMRHV